jgi:hypothetical protein
MAAMLSNRLIRRMAMRVAIATITRAVVTQLEPARHRVSRTQHLRNGVGAVLHTHRPSRIEALTGRRSGVGYGFGELRRAVSPPYERPRKRTLALAAVPAVAALAAAGVRSRRSIAARARSAETAGATG